MAGRCAEEIEWRIWDYDVDGMMAQAHRAFEERVKALRRGKAA